MRRNNRVSLSTLRRDHDRWLDERRLAQVFGLILGKNHSQELDSREPYSQEACSREP
jgi:hypothetical protein